MKTILPDRLLFIDIETVSAYPDFESMPLHWQLLWKQKVCRQVTEQHTPEQAYTERAGIMAEFGRIVCIGIGWSSEDSNTGIQTMSFADTDERQLLLRFLKWFSDQTAAGIYWTPAGHNIREFDIPFLCRRLLANRLPIPAKLNWQNCKPWEIQVVDSFQLWRFGDYKQFTSLDLLAALFGIPSSKQHMCGADVGPMYWAASDPVAQKAVLHTIEQYCLQDVVTTAFVIQALQGLDAAIE